MATPRQGDAPEVRERLAARGQILPVGRIGTAEELAEVYLMLMKNGYITGEVLQVDGGGRYA